MWSSWLPTLNEYQPVPGDPEELNNGNAAKGARYYSALDMQSHWVCGIGYEVRSISRVDCVAEEFSADISLFLKWFDERNTTTKSGELDGSALVNKPHVLVSNEIDLRERSCVYEKLAADPPGVIHCELIYTGIFREFFELENFPLDIQDLSIALRFVDPRWSVRLLGNPKFSNITSDVELSEWFMYQPRHATGRSELGNATWALKMKVLRKPGYYLSNVIGMMGCLTTLSFFAFLFQPENWACRSSYCATLLLTSVAFKFVVDGQLPKVSFTTILDLYMLVAFGMMVGIVFEAALVKFVRRMDQFSQDSLRDLDTGMAHFMVFCWIVWNVYYLCRFVSFSRAQSNKLGRLLPQLVTNTEPPGRCSVFLCCQPEDEDSADEGCEDCVSDCMREDTPVRTMAVSAGDGGPNDPSSFEIVA